MLDIENSIYSQMAADDKFLSTVANYAFVSKEDLHDSIMDELDIIKETQKDIETGEIKAEGNIVINIYTTKNGKFQALEVKNEEGIVLTSVSDNNITTYKLYEKNEVEYTFTYNEVEKEYSFKIDSADLKIKKIEDGLKVTYIGNGNNLEVTLTSKASSEKVNGNLAVNGDFAFDSSKAKLTFTYENELKKATAIDKFDVANATEFSTITPEQSQAIANKLVEVTKGSFLEPYAQSVAYMLAPPITPTPTPTEFDTYIDLED